MGWTKVSKPKQVKGPALGQEGGGRPQPETECGICFDAMSHSIRQLPCVLGRGRGL